MKTSRPGGWTRRVVLRRLAGLALIVAGGRTVWRVWSAGAPGTSERERLSLVLDTLIPDGEFPGARRTGILEPLVARFGATRQGRRIVREGLAWLDREARRRGAAGFASLAPEEREAVLIACGEAEPDSVPRHFFRMVRGEAMRLHYAHPLAWRAVGLAHPPQPAGYPDQNRAPHG